MFRQARLQTAQCYAYFRVQGRAARTRWTMMKDLASLEILTPRLLLRPLQMQDFDSWAAFMADPEATRFLGGAQPRALAWRSFMTMAGAWHLQGFSMFSVIERSSQRWVGRLGPWMPEGWPGTEVGGASSVIVGDAVTRSRARRSQSIGPSMNSAGARSSTRWIQQIAPHRRSHASSGRSLLGSGDCPHRSTRPWRSGDKAARPGVHGVQRL